jgi:carbamoyltransferase
MGLAPFGTDRYVSQFADLVHLDPDGGYELNLSWFKHHVTGMHIVSRKFLDTFGPPRPRTRVTAGNPIPQHYADIAYALQATLGTGRPAPGPVAA